MTITNSGWMNVGWLFFARAVSPACCRLPSPADSSTRSSILAVARVANWVQCQDMISAASFSPDGQLTAAGLYNGRVMFYHTKDLRYYTQASLFTLSRAHPRVFCKLLGISVGSFLQRQQG